MTRRIVSARDQVEMLSPWRKTADRVDLRWERDSGGNWILITRNPDGNPVSIGTSRAPSDRTSARTAGPRRRFTQDWQHVGFDLMPVDAVSHYMQRKETGFGDEKSELYQLNKQPPLSQQIRERGYEKPVHLVTDGKSGSIYDGHHRIDIARQLGHTHIPVEVSWRTPDLDPDYSKGMYGNKIEPWLKNWLTDVRQGREMVGRRTAASRPIPPLAVNINDTSQDYTGQILRGEKVIETRDTNSLRPLIGSRVGISRTHNSPRVPAMVVGYATLGEPKLYTNADDFNADYHLHRVGEESPHHFNKAKYGVKYGYPLHDVESEPEPFPPGPGNQKWRAITGGLSPDEEQRMRDTYAGYDPASPPEHLRPHLMLPTEIAHHYREYDRPYDEGLGRVIADQGIRQPLRISTDGTHAIMHEGNHRLEVAKRLGISHVPVQVTLEKPGDVVNNGGRSPVPLEEHLGNWVNQNTQNLKSFWS